MDRTDFTVPLEPPALADAVRLLLDEAHAVLPADCLAELLLGVRRALRRPGGGRAASPVRIPRVQPGASPATRVYLRVIERLLESSQSNDGPPSRAWVDPLDRYLDDLAARPKGATVGSTAA
jgi:hypothetical protein